MRCGNGSGAGAVRAGSRGLRETGRNRALPAPLKALNYAGRRCGAMDGDYKALGLSMIAMVGIAALYVAFAP